MEPSAVLALWEGDALTVYDSTQHVYAVQQGLAALFGIPVASVRVISHHTGGAFGVKGLIWPHEALAALAARIVKRPVRIALSRANMYSFLGYQPRIVQKMSPQRDGDWIVGQGMASCLMGTFRFPSRARVTMRRNGTAIIETGTQDIGTGTLTILPQIASEVLGLPTAKVELKMGDSAMPEAGPTYGSSSTMGVGAAVLTAATEVRGKLARLANLPPSEVAITEGRITRTGAAGSFSVADIMQQAGESEIVGLGLFDPTQHGTGYSMRTFGAVFVEVGVDPELGLLRLRRVVGSYSVGRVVNPRTARAQLIGGIIWGWGMAAMEQSAFEPSLGRFLSKNLAGVAIPVNADIPSDIAVHFVDEVDDKASPIGGKGVGELGATGVAAAVANAVFHATGKRIRDLPITPEKLVVAHSAPRKGWRRFFGG
jgi:xanthine dehydrogenase YagR molybdenum-binding subunit